MALLRSSAQCHEVAEIAWLTLWLPAPWLLWEDPRPDPHHWPLCLYLGKALPCTFCFLQTNRHNRLGSSAGRGEILREDKVGTIPTRPHLLQRRTVDPT